MTKYERGYLAGIKEGKKIQKELMANLQVPCQDCANRRERWRISATKYRQTKDQRAEDEKFKQNRLLAKVTDLKKKLRKVSEAAKDD